MGLFSFPLQKCVDTRSFFLPHREVETRLSTAADSPRISPYSEPGRCRAMKSCQLAHLLVSSTRAGNPVRKAARLWARKRNFRFRDREEFHRHRASLHDTM